ncbi:MAG TPA: conjugal transfer protein TraC [Clostridium sp.]|nr:conjugal transfer protein TraC [Clostridium sp.]
MSKKDVKSAEEIKQETKVKTAQQWMPIRDIDKSIVYRKDGILIGILRLTPINIDLLSNNEKKRIVDAVYEAINGETEPLQVFCIGRPVDLNSYIEWMQDKAKSEENFTRKQILKSYIQEASELAASGETTERRFYVIISKNDSPKKIEELVTKLRDLKSKFTNAGLKASVCNDDEIIDLYSLFSNPIQAAYERTEITYHYSTLLEDDN